LKKTRNLIVLGVIIPSLLIGVSAFVAYRSKRQLADSVHWVSHTLEVQRQLQLLTSLLVDAETGERGFLLTLRESYLEPYQLALDKIPRQINTLRDLTADNPGQQEQIRQVEPLVATNLAIMAQSISLQRKGEREAVLALVSMDRGKQAMDAIRARIELMQREESRLLVTRQQILATRARFNAGFLSCLLVLNLLFAAAVLLVLRRLSRIESLVKICAWSGRVEYQGQWISFEQYLRRRFNFRVSHGISPTEAGKVFGGEK